MREVGTKSKQEAATIDRIVFIACVFRLHSSSNKHSSSHELSFPQENTVNLCPFEIVLIHFLHLPAPLFGINPK
jgi:hypothetical protein